MDQAVSIPEENNAGHKRPAPPAAFAGAIVNDCASAIAANIAALRESGGEAEAVHQLRVSLRRARAALSIFVDVAIEESRALRDELRWASHEIAPVRELDVLIADALANAGEKEEGPAGVDVIRAMAMRRREEALEAALAAIGSARFEDMLSGLRQWAASAAALESDGADKHVGEDFAARDLRRRWRAVSKRREAITEGDDAARHKLRIRCKKLRLAIDFLADLTPAPPKRRKRTLKALSKLQGRLGRLNDASAHKKLLSDVAGSADAATAFAGGYIAGREAGGGRSALVKTRRAFDTLIDIGPVWK